MVTHQLQVERRTEKVRLSIKTDVLPTVPRNQPNEMVNDDNVTSRHSCTGLLDGVKECIYNARRFIMPARYAEYRPMFSPCPVGPDMSVPCQHNITFIVFWQPKAALKGHEPHSPAPALCPRGVHSCANNGESIPVQKWNSPHGWQLH